MRTPLTGTTSNGVPYFAVPPASDVATARSSFCGTSWMLGLPTFGARSLPGGVDEVMKLLTTDAPDLVHGPVHSQAAEEFPAD